MEFDFDTGDTAIGREMSFDHRKVMRARRRVSGVLKTFPEDFNRGMVSTSILTDGRRHAFVEIGSLSECRILLTEKPLPLWSANGS